MISFRKRIINNKDKNNIDKINTLYHFRNYINYIHVRKLY